METAFSLENELQVLKDVGDEFHVLYGGAGDGRHMLATILHAHRMWVDDDEPDFTLRCTMNDINAQVLAKDILVLVVTHRIGKLAQEYDLMHEEREPYLLAVVLYYATLGHAMPAVVYDKLQSLVQELFLNQDYKSFREAYPWIYVTESDWETFVRVFSHWADTSMYEPPLPSVKKVLATHIPATKPPTVESMSRTLGMAGMEGATERMRQGEEDRQAELEAAKAEISDINTWDSDFRAMIEAMVGEGATDEMLLDHAMKMLANMTPDDLEAGPKHASALPLDKQYLEATHALLPPTRHSCPMPELSRETDFIFADKLDRTSEKMSQAMRDHLSFIHKNWKTNPVKFDPEWYFLGSGHMSPDNMNPVIDWTEAYFQGQVLSTLTEAPDEDERYLYDSTLLELFIQFQWNLGISLVDLEESSSLVVEVNNGSILGFGDVVQNKAEERRAAGLPISYSRIFLSNVPDYVGMLSTFIQMQPLLGEASPGITKSTLRSNVLMNTGLFPKYDQYIYGTLALTADQVARTLRIRVLEEDPDVWNSFNQWGQDGKPARDKPVGPGEFKTWLHRLYLQTVLPPDRDGKATVPEERPNTVDTFLRTCAFCIEGLEYPVHWVMAALDELLDLGKPLKTKAALLNQSPAPKIIPPEKRANTYKLAAFRAELENQLSMWIQKGMLPDYLLNAILPAGTPAQFRIAVSGINNYTHGGFAGTMCLGFLLEEHLDPDFVDKPMTNMMPMMMMGRRKQSKLRHALLDRGDNVGHLFSCVMYNARDKCATFWMCEDVFERYKSFHFSLIRTDGWFRSDHSSIRLGDAERI